jgi:hypothetical protein
MTTIEKRKRQLLWLLPLAAVPLLAMLFYGFGGGHGASAAGPGAAANGINTMIPGAQADKGKPADKMGIYDQSERDSAEARSKTASGAFAALGWHPDSSHQAVTPNSTAASEIKIKEKLAEINKQINAPEPKAPAIAPGQDAQAAQLERLEALIKQKQQSASPDPQMQQLNVMLDKIQQIQNPGLVREKLQKDAAAEKTKPDSAFKAVTALIDGNQKVAPGGVVRLKLKDSITIGGVHYPAGQSLSGACSVVNQRLLLEIRNIRIGTSIIPVNLTVFSLDGMAGIAAPEAELAGAAGDGANGALDNMQFLSMDDNLSTQAATAGISAAKSLLGKKARKIRVKLKGGQTVLLRINKS